MGCVHHSALPSVIGNSTEHRSSQQRTDALCRVTWAREREAGGRQPSGRTEAEELGGGVCSQLGPRPRLQAPCRLAPQPASGLVQPMGSGDKYSEGRKPEEAGTFHPLGHGGHVPTGAASPSRLRISPPPSFLPRSFLPRSRHLSKGPASEFCPCVPPAPGAASPWAAPFSSVGLLGSSFIRTIGSLYLLCSKSLE